MNWTEFSHGLLEKCKKKRMPFHATFELTPFCNFQCNMCYIRLNSDQAARQGKLLTTEQWIKLADEAKAMGVISLEVTGGEAIIRPDFEMLYTYFINRGFLIILRTNGYAIDNKMLAMLSHWKPYKICVTIYGATDETYQKICGIRDGFSVVSKNILALRDAGLTVQVSATLTVDNIKEQESMRKWAADNGFQLTFAGMLLTPIQGTGRSVDHLRIKGAKEEYELNDEMKAIPREVINKDYYMNPFWMCRSYGAKFTITWDGKMTACNSNPSIWSDPINNDVAKAYNDLYQKLDNIRRPKECENCQYIDICSVCPSMLYSATGSMEKVNEEVCKYAHRKYKDLLFAKEKYKKNEIDSMYKCDEGEY